MRKKVVIYGAAAHASVVADILRRDDEYEIIGFLDDINPERKGETFSGLPVLGGGDQLDGLREQDVRHAIVGFGDSRRRIETAAMLANKGFRLVTAIHPSATVGWGSEVGKGTVVKAGAMIDPGVEIGQNVIVGAGVILAHGSILADGVRIAAGAAIGANVRLDRGAFIGLAATIRNGSTVGSFALVGAGSLVLGDVPEGMVAYGAPARTVREVADGDL